jgi:predicted molibdopterin-dependent oxidoreductase YjgC
LYARHVLLRGGLPDAPEGKDGFIYAVEAPFEAAPNYGMLCVKGRYGTDYVKHPGRVKTPLIRANRAEGRSAPPVWREATWDEALDLVADELVRVVGPNGGDAVASLRQRQGHQ